MTSRVDLYGSADISSDANETDEILALHTSPSSPSSSFAFLSSACLFSFTAKSFTKLNAGEPLLPPPATGEQSGGRVKSLLGNTSATTALFRTTATGTQLAVGSKDREVFLYDVATSKSVWKAKNIAPHPQTLLQYPLWQTALAFCDEVEDRLAVGTAFKELRLYDLRQRKPTLVTKEGVLEARVTALCNFENSIVVGDAAGYLQELDVRTGKVLGRFASPGGSVRAIQRVPGSGSKFACVGLDRMCRVYSTRGWKEKGHVYLKQRLNCVLVSGDVAEEDYGEGGEGAAGTAGEEVQNDEEDEDDEVEDLVVSDSEGGGSDSEDSSSGEEDEEDIEADAFFKPERNVKKQFGGPKKKFKR